MNAVFYIAAAVAVVSTVMVITRANAVYSLLYLIVSLLSVAGANGAFLAADLLETGSPGVLKTDADGDGVLDGADNCPAIANAAQSDTAPKTKKIPAATRRTIFIEIRSASFSPRKTARPSEASIPSVVPTVTRTTDW